MASCMPKLLRSGGAGRAHHTHLQFSLLGSFDYHSCLLCSGTLEIMIKMQTHLLSPRNGLSGNAQARCPVPNGHRRHLTSVSFPDTTVAICFILFETRVLLYTAQWSLEQGLLLPQPPQWCFCRGVLPLPDPAFLVILTEALNNRCTTTVPIYIQGKLRPKE
jgi:hypothetical protein